MRGFDCADGVHIHASDDEELLGQLRRHADDVHADQGFTDEQLQGFVAQGAYDDTQHAQASA